MNKYRNSMFLHIFIKATTDIRYSLVNIFLKRKSERQGNGYVLKTGKGEKQRYCL